jgi:hypothetical protein
MKRLFVVIILTLAFSAHAEKTLRKCHSANGSVRHTTIKCDRNEREEIINKNKTLAQFAQNARSTMSTADSGLDNSDLTYFLKKNYSTIAWVENVKSSYLESTQAVVVVDTFSMNKLEAICQATLKWIEDYPHSRFELEDMRFEFNTGEGFDERYVKKSTCNFELRS